MKVFCAVMIHETSRFSPIPTGLENFREAFLYLPSTGEGSDWRSQTLDGVNWAEIWEARGHKPAFGLLAGAQPSRPMGRENYARLRTEMLDAVAAAMPLDAVALFLHGAQVAEGTDDCEGDLLAAIRDVVGPSVPIGVSFDLHGNVSDTMIESADIALACLEYPHIDFGDRAEQLAGLLERTVAGEINPVLTRQRVPMLGTYYTTEPAMRELVDAVRSLEGEDNILAVSLTHGFAWSDVADCSANVILCTDGETPKAKAVLEDIANRYFAMRDTIRAERMSAEDAIAEAMRTEDGPVIIADTTDNPGGGAAGDSTFLLRALLDAGASDAALGMLWDPMAVRFALRAGPGARMALRIGGKCGPGSGAPLDVEAEIVAGRTDATQLAQGMDMPLGDAVLIKVDGISIVLNSLRNQVFDPACFEAFGIDPRTQKIVVVKGQQHFHEAFAPFAARIIYATPPGAVSMDYRAMQFERIPRPIYPLDEPPFDAFGRNWSA
ncbi:M81 family metallopeptidase [Parasphingopyxis sp.]|uniref:M81 family metallopeptidase n=1 Tax=Parasphingopyxis sp. TaxID=1920299 RepID=UPI002632D22E|nr:M81 family metallopeptidase [Parasphingopyxis sp.]